MSVVHTSRLRIEKHEGPHRTAHVNLELELDSGLLNDPARMSRSAPV